MRCSHHYLFDAKGCHPKTSLTLEWPKSIRKDFKIVSNFILGYFDGDGCIHLRKDSAQMVISFVGTRRFLAALQQNITSHVSMEAKGCLMKVSNENCFSLHYGGNSSLLKIFDIMYSNAPHNLILQRKFLIGNFYKRIACLSIKERKEKIETFLQSEKIQQLKSCQIDPILCKRHNWFNWRLIQWFKIND